MKAQTYNNTGVRKTQHVHNNKSNKNLALAVRKEHNLTVVKGVTKKAIRVSLKTLAYLAFLFIANVLV